MPQLSHHDIQSVRELVLKKHGPSKAVDDFAGYVLDQMRAHHLNTMSFHERKVAAIEKDMEKLACDVSIDCIEQSAEGE